MLHSQSRKDRTKGYRALAFLAGVAICSISTACNSPLTPTEAAAQQRLQLLTDSAQDAQRYLEQIVCSNHDTLLADQAACSYYHDGGAWLWVTREDTTRLATADSLATFLENKSLEMGFAPNTFYVDSIRHQLSHFSNLDFDSTGTSVSKTMAALELTLSKAYLRYALGQRYGFMDPQRVFNHNRVVYDIALEKPTDSIASDMLRHALDEQPSAYLETCESNHPVYQRLKQLLPDSTSAQAHNRILCNMERLRWRHVNAVAEGQRHVFVNIPSQQLWAVSNDSVLNMRICCGAWKTKTPLLTSKIRLIQLNPEWNIPGSILRGEVSRHGGDSSYFARNRYFIINRSTGDTVSAKSITQQDLRSGKYRVAQRSGRGNSLGRIIFRFNNQFDVYLHDTNNRSAFNNAKRTISHGCVRVERPFDLAMFLLPNADEWTLDRMRMSIDMQPQSARGKEYRRTHSSLSGIKMNSTGVEPQVPLVIDYYTFYPNPENGTMETWPDRYEYDVQIESAIKPFLP